MRRITTTVAAALLTLSAAAHADSAPSDGATPLELAPAAQEVNFEPLSTESAAAEDAPVTRRDGAMVFEAIDLAGKIQYPAVELLLGSPRIDLQVTPREDKTFACKIPSTLRNASL